MHIFPSCFGRFFLYKKQSTLPAKRKLLIHNIDIAETTANGLLWHTRLPGNVQQDIVITACIPDKKFWNDDFKKRGETDVMRDLQSKVLPIPAKRPYPWNTVQPW